jgi:two-component system, chemotaxis family, protein-glutamate methylesterase/glutaminase
MVSLKVLIVDDSAFMRKIISDILNQDRNLTVVGTAKNGVDAIKKTQSLQPDVITMDVEMPEMNGIEAVTHIMKEHPTPIVMVSALTSQGAKTTIDSLHAGAIDFICKPAGSISLNMKEIGTELVRKVKTASTANVRYAQKTKMTMPPPSSRSAINVFLVDDSPFFLKKISQIISSQTDMKIIGTAHDGGEAIQKIQQVHPDVVLMDINMPSMNGVTATQQILQQQSLPIIVISGETNHNMKDIKRALDAGAIDFIPKPAEHTSIHTMSDLLLEKVRKAPKTKKHFSKSKDNTIPLASMVENLLVIGSSTGGPQTLTKLIPHLPRDINAGILIVQHMPPVFTKSLAERLDSLSKIEVREAKNGDEIKNGVGLIAPGDYHMTVEEKNVLGKQKRFVSLNKEPKLHGVRPAVDVMFSTAADIFQKKVVAVLLTGMGRDGAQSMGAIKAKGGRTIAQDEQTSIIFGMPKAAIELGVADKVLPLQNIASQSTLWLKRKRIGGIAR